MSNIIYNYPKSSCACYNCIEKNRNIPIPIPSSDNNIHSNMSISNCEIPSIFECYDRKVFRVDIEPQNDNKYVKLNPQVMESQYAKDFKCADSSNNNCPKIQYVSNDPRLISTAHSGQVQTLDIPPIDGNVSLDKIYTDSKLNNYGALG